jgi:GNAT superfamily N-acetyltransferase
VRGNEHLSDAQKKKSMRKLVESGVPIGVLAYDGGEPVGWCSIAPRETYVKLERSRTMSRETPPVTSTWVVLCFFVARPHRKKGLTRVLLEGAVAYARAQGAQIIEGYPFDTAGISSTHRGHSTAFKAARFRQQENRWSLRLRKD